MRVIVNADDFSWDESTNEAILELLRLKMITSTSVLANSITPDLARELNKFKDISVGLHFNIIEGLPSSNPDDISSLVDRNGVFYPAHILLLKCFCALIKREHVEVELKSQIDALHSCGLEISHLDGHQHTHIFPIISTVIAKNLKGYGIERVRTVSLFGDRTFRLLVVRFLSYLSRHKYRSFSGPKALLSTRIFEQGVPYQVLNRFKGEVIEVMVHPRVKNTSLCHLDREKEYNKLKSGYLQSEFSNCEFISYKEV